MSAKRKPIDGNPPIPGMAATPHRCQRTATCGCELKLSNRRRVSVWYCRECKRWTLIGISRKTVNGKRRLVKYRIGFTDSAWQAILNCYFRVQTELNRENPALQDAPAAVRQADAARKEQP